MAHTDEDLIGIPFPNHSNDVLCSLNEQRRDGLLCDVILIVRDQEFRTHRSVLAACSRYFKKLFTVPTSTSRDSNQHAIYELDFVAPESLTAILEFAYTSTLTVTASNVKKILSAARLLEMSCIINVCLEIMDTGGGDQATEGEIEEDDEDEDEEDEMEEVENDSKYGDDHSEKSVQQNVSKNQDGRKDLEERAAASPPNGFQQELHPEQNSHKSQRCQINTPEVQHAEKPRGPEGLECRALKDFSIESLLQEGLYPKVPGLERGASFSPLLPGIYLPMWAVKCSVYSQFEEPGLTPHPFSGAALDNSPLDLNVKKEVIKEGLKDEPSNPTPHKDIFKDFMNPGLGVTSDHAFGQIKDGTELQSYLNFLSASHLGTLFPPWQLEEERKMKPKPSQQCPICNRVIQGAGKLTRHMRTHTGEKPYMCTICEVRFTRQDKLKIHLRKHAGERPYTCPHCNSQFVHNYELKNHVRIHTGVRPYQCEHCCRSFTRSDHLHRHIKRQSCRLSRPRSTNFLFPPDPNTLQGDRTMRLPAAGTPLLA